jgi:ABC-type antimicrobial peptide transport system permease subunit
MIADIRYALRMLAKSMGIRITLGAKGADILRLVFSNAMATTIIGIVIGLVAAFALTRLLQSLLYQVTATDPVVFAAIPLLLLFVALVACYLPARRAARLDPKIALAQS